MCIFRTDLPLGHVYKKRALGPTTFGWYTIFSYFALSARNIVYDSILFFGKIQRQKDTVT